MKGGKTRDGLRTRVMLSPCARAYADRICASVHLTGGGCTVPLQAAVGGWVGWQGNRREEAAGFRG